MDDSAITLPLSLTPSVGTKTKTSTQKTPRKLDDIDNKLRGGYYTPKEITDFLVKWAVKAHSAKILEPSCGDGQFVESLASRFGDKVHITGVELFSMEARKAQERGTSNTRIHVGDAFSWFTQAEHESIFDAVVGNPPFIRYQSFPEAHRTKAFQIMREEGLSPSRLTNAWVPFVVLATRALKKGGRLAFVLPAELLQVTYASELRKYLSSKYTDINVLTFRKLVFPGIQQEAILFLGQRGDCKASKISLLEFENLAELSQKVFKTKQKAHKILSINHDNEKWTQFYLSKKELDLIRDIESSHAFTRLGDYAEVDVGVVTGNNGFFILGEEEAAQFGVDKYCSPIIGRSKHIPGLLFNKKDYEDILKAGERGLILNIGDLSREKLDKKLLAYINNGELNGVADGYKCNIRKPNWWRVPSLWQPDAFLLRQIHEGPRIIANESDATSTDTVHRVKLTSNMSAKALAALSFNSLTFAFSEIKGRSYGGGVLELEPTEAENLLLPNIEYLSDIPAKKLDWLVREKKTEVALDLMDRALLDAGLNQWDVSTLRGVWTKLRTRRNSRK